MVKISVRSVRKGEGDYGGMDLWKRKVLSLKWNWDAVMHSESGVDDDYDDDDDDDDELM